MGTYTLRDIQGMFGISRAVVSSLVAAGLVSPTRGARGEYRFSFQDVVMLRTAHSLHASRVQRQRIIQSLKGLREAQSADQPLTGLRICAVGKDVAVKGRDGRWQAVTGQLLIDFEAHNEAGRGEGTVHALRRPTRVADPGSARDWFALGCQSEGGGGRNDGEAEAAYRRALALDPDYLDPYLNLGCLLCDAGRYAEAVALYREALRHFADEALIHFNLAVALEDLGESEAALESYDACIALSPDFADAHFNVARLHQVLGDKRRAIRHFNHYRKLQTRT
jgi:Flp pilus assembly protein TadD